ncbi:putative LRR receptor-like serine/threonine-protein kinase RLK [Apostasia shenzhenica]|uniref:Putative LRR receptor-like serine/threonine-protein kinase RLK n=1 Tax=Apostasia shenzhenica TaxID=1088818 RepID=A0A2H9ZVW2_9ASPA|nr:putative LRR receptor-like serine/threonine-protein kinase RLK [Apostasia shenzhenica]
MASQAALRHHLISSALLLLFAAASLTATARGNPEEAAVLLRFRSALSGSGAALPSWVGGAAPCNVNKTTWDGVICFNDHVWGIQLEGRNLTGRLDLSILAALRSLRTVSFMGNDLEGPLPELSRLGALKAAYFSGNRFSGEIPADAFAGMGSLKKLFLSNNDFSGPIPPSLAGLGKLLEVGLDHNKFAGRIPEFRQPELEKVDLSFNRLDGPIPERLAKMDSALFQGNDGLCGKPLTVTCDENGRPKRGLSGGLLAVIVLVIVIIALLLLIIIILAAARRQQQPAATARPSIHQNSPAAVDAAEKLEKRELEPTAGGGKKAGKESDHGRLAFVREGRERFELQDLLRAPAEVLGSGNLGSSYKAALAAGAVVVVKRFKEMNGAGREDFNEHMRRLGRLSHPNVLPLVAYYYKKEEKLLVYDFVANGSLAHMLHGKRGSSPPALDWPTRLKIVKGVARGLAYLYDQLPVLSLPHGHLKSSNVLLTDSFESLLSDYALAPVVNITAASQLMVAYKSPEAARMGRPSKKSDVWSLGVLLLEILTGKFPASVFRKGNGSDHSGAGDLAGWVRSVAREDWDGEVFDSDMRGAGGRVEMRKLMEVALECCEEDVERRVEMSEALERIEKLQAREDDKA